MSEFISPGTAFAPLPSPFTFKRGGEIRQGRMAFETWGRLNELRDNAVLTAYRTIAKRACRQQQRQSGQRLVGSHARSGQSHRYR